MKSKHNVWPVGQYRLNQPAEMPRRPGAERELLKEGEIVFWDGQPGPHMEPLDDAAIANVHRVDTEFGGMPTLNPTENLALSMGGGSIDDQIAVLQAQISELRAMRGGSAGNHMAHIGGGPIIPPPAPIAKDSAR